MQQSKEERVHDVFEKISDKYDVINSVISFHTPPSFLLPPLLLLSLPPSLPPL
ncbi:class I SAM-dependent methyltransferase, partial [Bacillus paranthracis]|uniref:class I SAM-dependent methyltransferase n=1 Tax=Bacillus paranthracis TaxID=2026186 RepID=UPI0035E3DAEA